jgi:lipopolysaccharide/colanic/teichoic acid biosynthesis glycosyltransferase
MNTVSHGPSLATLVGRLFHFAPSPISDEARRAWYQRGKRALDLTLTVALLVLLLPLFVLIALAIKLDSPGPALFVQERVGVKRRTRHGRVSWEISNFRCFKFRSMTANADPSLHREYIRDFVHGRTSAHVTDGTFKLDHDPRITRVGRVLRRTSLDELPQLVNVLKGEMSLVGPRPVPVYEVAECEEMYARRLATLPGMTGLWQVLGRAEVPFVEMIRLDSEYVRNQSLWLDLKILAATVPVVLSGRGAR